MSIILPVLITLHVIVCLFLVLVVLMQRPRSEGLGSAFGGGLTDNVFGSQTTNVLARFTTWMGVAFFSITLLLSILTARASAGKTAVQEKLLSAPAPVVAPTPVVAPAAAAAVEATPTPAPTPEQPAAQQESPAPAVEPIVPTVSAPALQEATDPASSAGLESATDTAQPVTTEAAPAPPEAEAPVPPAN
jgi:preprotein translocase subunit SecG